MMASSFITISISSTRNWAYVTCACRHGYPAGCRSTSTATTGWPVSCVSRVSNMRLIDNAFVEIADWPRAQRIANGWTAKRMHRKLDEFARRYCPVYRDFATGYHWSTDQCEYATDIVFRQQADLQAIYENLARTAIHTVKPDHIATFLGRKLSTQF